MNILTNIKKPALKLFIGFVLLFSYYIGPKVNAQTQTQIGAPQVFKYQAVLRDVTGKELSSRNDINIRISLRKNSESGEIVYSEEHLDKQTNPFGLLNLEIGRGQALEGSFVAVSWGEAPIFIQIELELGDGAPGYTQMGVAELLSVPYALYAANAGGGNIISLLDDNYIPKFNSTTETFVNSGLSQNDEALRVLAKKVIFEFEGGKSYTFPSSAGASTQVLTLLDNEGTLGWKDVVGGSGGTGNDPRLNDLGENNSLLFWNNDLNRVRSSHVFVGGGINDSLNITKGDVFIQQGSVYVHKDILVGSNAEIKGNVVISGKASMDSATIQKEIKVGGNANIGGDAEISGNTKIRENATITKGLTVGADASIGGTVTIASKTYIRDNLIVKPSDSLVFGDLFYPFNAENSEANSFVMLSKTKDSLVLKGLKTKGSIILKEDTLIGLGANYVLDMQGSEISLDSNGFESSTSIDITDYLGVWKQKGNNVIHTNNALDGSGSPIPIKVGIGDTVPKTTLSVLGGGVKFVSNNFGEPISAYYDTVEAFAWVAERAALRAGRIKNINSFNVGNYSVALGYNNLAMGEASVALGSHAVADSDYSMAIGSRVNAQGNNSFSVGVEAYVTSENSFALGNKATVRDTNSFALGLNVESLATNSFALGLNVESSAVNSFALGSGAKSTAERSIAIGVGGNLASPENLIATYGINSIAIGTEKVRTLAPNAIAIGTGIEARSSGEASLSMGNNLISNAPFAISIGNYIENNADEAIMIGIGRSSTISYAGEDAVGSITIGRSNWTEAGFSTSIGRGLKNEYHLGLIWLGNAGGEGLSRYNEASDLQAKTEKPIFLITDRLQQEADNLNTANLLEVGANGDMHVLGSVYSQGSIISSDYRLKEVIKPLSLQSSVLDSLIPVSFRYLNSKDKHLDMGFIAQEVREVFPDLVRESKNGYLSMNYIGLISVLWKINQEFKKDIETTKEKLQEQGNKIDAQQLEIDGLKKQIQDIINQIKQ